MPAPLSSNADGRVLLEERLYFFRQLKAKSFAIASCAQRLACASTLTKSLADHEVVP